MNKIEQLEIDFQKALEKKDFKKCMIVSTFVVRTSLKNC